MEPKVGPCLWPTCIATETKSEKSEIFQKLAMQHQGKGSPDQFRLQESAEKADALSCKPK
jgi:hypothetical protein